jgi:glycerophosphoryl diester phosphodiesterase
MEGMYRQRRESQTVTPSRTAAATTAHGRARPLLLGHRGARPVSRFGLRNKVPPENTIACFEYALAHGCDGFEFDVRVTGDNRLVLCHDARIGRRNVSASSFESLSSAATGSFACLHDVLKTFGQRAYLDIEVKVAGAEELIKEALEQLPPQCGYLVSSFLPDVLLRLHELDSSIPLGYVCQRPSSLPLWSELPIKVFLPHYRLLTEELVGEVHARGLQIFTWTVNRERDMLRLAEWRIDGLISDDPDRLARTFARQQFLAKNE